MKKGLALLLEDLLSVMTPKRLGLGAKKRGLFFFQLQGEGAGGSAKKLHLIFGKFEAKFQRHAPFLFVRVEEEGLELGMKTLLLSNFKRQSISNMPLIMTLQCQYLTLVFG